MARNIVQQKKVNSPQKTTTTPVKQTTPPPIKKKESKYNFPLDTINLIMIGGCILLIAIGFILMLGGSNEGDTFNNDIFNTRRTLIGPMISLLGFVLMVVAIMFRGKKKDKDINE